MQGSARMRVFNTGPHANTTDFRAGDVGLVRRNCGHYVENTGDDDLVFIETFRSDRYEEVSLANWLSHVPPKLVSAHRARAAAGTSAAACGIGAINSRIVAGSEQITKADTTIL
jgi:oxalate decarboxylase/phosphoglucose isomerase-like protein (cupin superfamily)